MKLGTSSARLGETPASYGISMLGILLVMEVVCYTFDLPTYILPPPSDVLPFLVARLSDFSAHFEATFTEVALGFSMGWILAVLLATGVVFIPFFGALVRPLIVMTQTVPVLAIAPILIMWFGFGIWGKVATSALLVIFPVFVGVSDGLLNVPQRLLDFLRASRANKYQIFWYVRVPQAVSSIIPATKIGITLSIIGAVIGEFITAEYGIGLVIRQATVQMDTVKSFAMLYCLGLAGVTLYSTLDVVEILLKRKFRQIEGGSP